MAQQKSPRTDKKPRRRIWGSFLLSIKSPKESRRDGAGADYEKLGELEYGDTVRAYDTKRADNGNKWIKIRYEGKYGWVAMSNLEEEGA